MPNSKVCSNCNPFKACKCWSIFSRVFKFLHRKAERRRSSRKFSSIHAIFWPLMSMRSDERDRIGEAPNPTDTVPVDIERDTATIQLVPVPVEIEPIRPSLTKIAQGNILQTTSEKPEENPVERACKSFEKCLMEMLVEEKKIRDLLDVEELMFCMDKLKSPAFVELVCTFYGELCMDLFSNNGDEV